MTGRGEVVAPLYLLIKDHKGWSFEGGTPPPSRPVCSGNKGFNRHISEILSLILEPLGHAIGGQDIDSTGGLLAAIGDLNETLKDKDWKKERVEVECEDKATKTVLTTSSSAETGVRHNPTNFGLTRFDNKKLKVERIKNLRSLR